MHCRSSNIFISVYGMCVKTREANCLVDGIFSADTPPPNSEIKVVVFSEDNVPVMRCRSHTEGIDQCEGITKVQCVWLNIISLHRALRPIHTLQLVVYRVGKNNFLPGSKTWRQKFPADQQSIFVLNLHVHKHIVF